MEIAAIFVPLGKASIPYLRDPLTLPGVSSRFAAVPRSLNSRGALSFTVSDEGAGSEAAKSTRCP